MKAGRTIIYITLSAVVFVGAIFMYRWANQSETVVPQIRPTSETRPADRSRLTVSTQYYSTIVAGDFRILERQGTRQNDVLDRLVASKSAGSTSCQLAITVASLPSDGLPGVSDVHYRVSSPDLYAATSVKGMSQDSLAFRSVTSHELDVFIPHSNLYASVALSSLMGSADDCSGGMEGMLSSWLWL